MYYNLTWVEHPQTHQVKVQTMRSFLPYENRRRKFIEGNKQFAI